MGKDSVSEYLGIHATMGKQSLQLINKQTSFSDRGHSHFASWYRHASLDDGGSVVWTHTKGENSALSASETEVRLSEDKSLWQAKNFARWANTFSWCDSNYVRVFAVKEIDQPY